MWRASANLNHMLIWKITYTGKYQLVIRNVGVCAELANKVSPTAMSEYWKYYNCISLSSPILHSTQYS